MFKREALAFFFSSVATQLENCSVKIAPPHCITLFEVITMQNKVGCIGQHFWMFRSSTSSKKYDMFPSYYILQKLTLILSLQEYSKWQIISTDCTFGEFPIEIMSGVMIPTLNSCRS